MHNNKYIEHQDIKLQKLVSSDKVFFTSLYTSKTIMRHICAPFTQLQAHSFFTTVLASMQADRYNSKYKYYLIHSQACKQAVGIVGLNGNDYERNTAEIGTLIKPHFQRSGFGIRASLLLINHAFTELALKRVDALCDPANEGTLRTMKKLGFKRKKKKRNKQGVLCEYWSITPHDIN